MATTLIQIINEFLSRTGLPSTNSAIGSPDQQVTQIVSLANEICEDLTERNTWEQLQQETVFTTITGTDQGSITSIAPNGFLYILNQTIFDRTLRLPVYGPLSPEQWQQYQAIPLTGPLYQFRIRGGRLLYNPPAAVGHVCAFEYASDACNLNPNTGLFNKWFTSDQDQFLLDTRLLMAGLRWKWKAEKGLGYAEDFATYEGLVANAKGRDGSKPTLSMDSSVHNIRPGIMVPSGSWNLP